MAAFRTDAVNGKLDDATRRAFPAIQGQNLLLVAQQHDWSGFVLRRVILPNQFPKAGVFAIGLQGPLHLNLRIHAPGNLKTRNPVRDAEQRRIPPIPIAGHKDQIARWARSSTAASRTNGWAVPASPTRIPKRFLHLGSAYQIPGRAKRPAELFGWERQ